MLFDRKLLPSRAVLLGGVRMSSTDVCIAYADWTRPKLSSAAAIYDELDMLGSFRLLFSACPQCVA